MWCLPWPSPLPLPFEPLPPELSELPWLVLDGVVGTTAGETTAPIVKPVPASSVSLPAAGARESAGGEDDGIRSEGAGEWRFGLKRHSSLRDGLRAGFREGFELGLDAGEIECGVVTGPIACVADWTTTGWTVV